MSVNPISAGGTASGVSFSSPVSTSTTLVSASNNQLNVNPASQLNEQSFLTLLSAELQYQDPLQPMDNTQFVAELAEFSQLAAVTSQTSTLQDILKAVQQNASSLIDASQLIGKVVTTASGESGEVTGVLSGQSGLTFDVAGIGAVPASQLTGVSEGTASASTSSISTTTVSSSSVTAS
ncbi:MAG: flagellar hook capping protein [Firmicutes bacterium]|nr:flagellar hook capping protein [Bacillota bacterium]